MLKVTLIFFLLFWCGCHNSQSPANLDQYELQLNKDAEARIDAAYKNIQEHCDSVMTYYLPVKVDSIIKAGKKETQSELK